MNHAIKMITIPEELYHTLLDAYNGKINTSQEFPFQGKDMDTYSKSKVLNHKNKIKQKIIQEAEKPQKIEIVNLDTEKIIETKPEKTEVFVEPVKEEDLKEEVQYTYQEDYISNIVDDIIAKRYEYGVTEEGKILNDSANVVRGSDIYRSVQYLLEPEKFEKRPPGTKHVREKIETNSLFINLKKNGTSQEQAPSKTSFGFSLWS